MMGLVTDTWGGGVELCLGEQVLPPAAVTVGSTPESTSRPGDEGPL